MAVQVSSDGSVIATGGADYAVKLFKKDHLSTGWKVSEPAGRRVCVCVCACVCMCALRECVKATVCICIGLRVYVGLQVCSRACLSREPRLCRWQSSPRVCLLVVQEVNPSGAGHTGIVTAVNFRCSYPFSLPCCSRVCWCVCAVCLCCVWVAITCGLCVCICYDFPSVVVAGIPCKCRVWFFLSTRLSLFVCFA